MVLFLSNKIQTPLVFSMKLKNERKKYIMGRDSIIQQELFYSGHYRKRKEGQRNRKEKKVSKGEFNPNGQT